MSCYGQSKFKTPNIDKLAANGLRFTQAVRWGKWKAVRFGWEGPILLFDMTQDISEADNVAREHPDVVKKIEDYMKTARVESPNWPDRMLKKK